MSKNNEVLSLLNQIKGKSKIMNKPCVFTIGNTAKTTNQDFYLTPVREFSDSIVAGCVVYSVGDAIEIGKLIDGKVDYVFVDSEKKISPENYGPNDVGNIERAVREVVSNSKIFTFKGNDLVVEAVDLLVSELLNFGIRGLGGKKAAILGAGNIGLKTAIKLVERGLDIFLFRRDQVKLNSAVTAINIIKPAETQSTVHYCKTGIEAARNADILIGTSGGQPVIDQQMVEMSNVNSFIIDVGKGCVSQEAIRLCQKLNKQIYRADIRFPLGAHISKTLSSHKHYTENMGRGIIEGINIISSGLLGAHGDVVVDSISNPQTIYGISDGAGDFIRELTNHDKLILEKLNRSFRI